MKFDFIYNENKKSETFLVLEPENKAEYCQLESLKNRLERDYPFLIWVEKRFWTLKNLALKLENKECNVNSVPIELKEETCID